MGGTELAKKWLYEHVDNSLLDEVNIVSRPEDYKEGQKNILWVHDLPADMPFLGTPAGRNMFSGIVFVSAWQQTVFFMNMGVKYSESTVIRNAIRPIKDETMDDGIIHLIYHPTPHRGLELLVPAFDELCSRYSNLQLDVFSNFDLYKRPEANASFESLYEACRSHPKITYHGTKSNDEVRSALAKADIFSYPCIWRETSCISALEAMSAKCLVVAPEYSALPETLGAFGISYPWTESSREHIERFVEAMSTAIEMVTFGDSQHILDAQKTYVDTFYNWEVRALEWERYLKKIISEPVMKKRQVLQWN